MDLKARRHFPPRFEYVQNCTISLSCALTTGLLAFSSAATAYTGQELAKGAKISISQAHQTALKAHPGKITDQELEKEKGGGGLRYSFDIKRGSATRKAGVDAETGKVLENKSDHRCHSAEPLAAPFEKG